jgi:hypothetical protein
MCAERGQGNSPSYVESGPVPLQGRVRRVDVVKQLQVSSPRNHALGRLPLRLVAHDSGDGPAACRQNSGVVSDARRASLRTSICAVDTQRLSSASSSLALLNVAPYATTPTVLQCITLQRGPLKSLSHPASICSVRACASSPARHAQHMCEVRTTDQ